MATSGFFKCTFILSILGVLASSSPTEESPVLTVLKLQRTSVILPESAERAGKRKNFYTAKLKIGTPPQEFNVYFDLDGGSIILPAQQCTDPACLKRHRYDRWSSRGADDIQVNGSIIVPPKRRMIVRHRRDVGRLDIDSIDIGRGKVKGEFVRDKVCVAEGVCFPLQFLEAVNMSDEPFLTEPCDGHAGLALKGLSLSSEFHFLTAFVNGHYRNTMTRNGFGMHIGNEADGGEITLGGYDMNRLTHPLKWASVIDPEEGHWQIAVSAIHIGNTTLEACRNQRCRAALDYSSSLLGFPVGLLGDIQNSLAKLTAPQGFGDGCQVLAMPEISLQLTDNFTLVVPPEDYVSDFGARMIAGADASISTSSCDPVLAHHHAEENIGQNVFILGESVMRRYYTFFDADALRVGFSLAQPKHGKGETGSGAEVTEGDQKIGASKSHTPMIIL